MTSKTKKGPDTGRAVTLLRTRATGSDSAQPATLGQAFAKGGSSRLYAVEPALAEPRVAKILSKPYRDDTALDPLAKILTLVSHHDRLMKDLPFVLWPDALVLTAPSVTSTTFRAATIGFTMAPLPAGMVALHSLLKVPKHHKHFESGATVQLAARLADQMARLNAAGFVFADLNPKNIYVNDDLTKLVFLDADGYQLSLAGTIMPTRGVTQGYASASAIANFTHNPTAVRSTADDDFVLAILIFQLLVDRAHPFDTGAAFAERPNASLNDGITSRWYAYADPKRFKPSDEALARYRRLVPPLKEAFYRSFLGSTPMPAAEWARLLAFHAAAPLADTATPEPDPAILTTKPAWVKQPASAPLPSRRSSSRRLPPVTAPQPSLPSSNQSGPVVRRFRRLAAIGGIAAPLAFASWQFTAPASPPKAEVASNTVVTTGWAATTVAHTAPTAPATQQRAAAMVRARSSLDTLLAQIDQPKRSR